MIREASRVTPRIAILLGKCHLLVRENLPDPPLHQLVEDRLLATQVVVDLAFRHTRARRCVIHPCPREPTLLEHLLGRVRHPLRGPLRGKADSSPLGPPEMPEVWLITNADGSFFIFAVLNQATTPTGAERLPSREGSAQHCRFASRSMSSSQPISAQPGIPAATRLRTG